MKKQLSLTLLALLLAAGAYAKDIKTAVFVTTQPQMHCQSCENRIKGNLRFVKGVKQIDTDVPSQTVTVQYDAEKTSPEKIVEGFRQIGYEVRQVPARQQPAQQPARQRR